MEDQKQWIEMSERNNRRIRNNEGIKGAKETMNQ
jgi:hypothetical protein